MTAREHARKKLEALRSLRAEMDRVIHEMADSFDPEPKDGVVPPPNVQMDILVEKIAKIDGSINALELFLEESVGND